MPIEKLDVVINAKDNFSGKAKKMESGFSQLKTAAIGLATAFATVKLKQFISESIELYKVQEKAEARLTAGITNLKNLGAGYDQTAEGIQKATQDLKDYAAQLQTVTTFGDEAIISAEAMLSTFQLSTGEIKQLTPALLDMAASMEKTSGQTADLNDIAIAMGKAMTMGAGALGRYGIVLTDVQKEQYALAEGAEKTALLVEILTDNFGGAARELAQTTAGQLKQAADRWGDFKESVGAVLAPLLLDIVTYLEKQATLVKYSIEILQEYWDNFWNWLVVKNANSWELIVNGAKVMGNFFIMVFNGLIAPAKAIFDIIYGIFSTFINLVTADWDGAWESVKNTFINVWNDIKDFIEFIAFPIIETFKQIVEWIEKAINKLKFWKSESADTGGSSGGGSANVSWLSGKRASGGAVAGGSSYLVGERGAEIFTPSTNGMITPNNKIGSTVVFNFNGAITDRQAAEQIGDMMLNKLKTTIKVA